MSYYRINTRFDLENEAECHAAEYLMRLSESGAKSRNRFIVEAVISQIERLAEKDTDTLLRGIRQIFREEIQEIAIAAPAGKKATTIDTVLTAEEQEKNAADVLCDLEMFG